MVWEHVHQEQARHIEENKMSIQELAGIAPLCAGCGDREAEKCVDGRDLCGDCLEGL